MRYPTRWAREGVKGVIFSRRSVFILVFQEVAHARSVPSIGLKDYMHCPHCKKEIEAHPKADSILREEAKRMVRNIRIPLSEEAERANESLAFTQGWVEFQRKVIKGLASLGL